jgi:hypothetical protein
LASFQRVMRPMNRSTTSFRRQLQRVVGHARQVHDQHDRAHDRRELEQVALAELVGRQRGVGGAEIDGAVGDLVDAAARADRLVVQLHAGALAGGLAPTLVDGTGKAGAGAGDRRELREAGAGQERGGSHAGGEGHQIASVH